MTVVLDRATKVYSNGVLAVDDLQIRVHKGELLVLLGPSGCGKTTILRMIAGLEKMTSGNLWLNGELANDLPPQQRNIAMVFQNGALYPRRTVRGNLAFPLRVAGTLDKEAVSARVTELARGLGLVDLLDRMPGTLSGGERQRVGMGRALAKGEPTVLLMDEPLASLDASMRGEFRTEIEALVRSLGLTTIYVTHDQWEAMTLADRIAVLRDGVLQDIGPPARVYDDPATAFVAAFLGSPPINLLTATIWLEIGEHIVIDFGPQRLRLPWADSRTGILAAYQGQTVLAGIRPEMLVPVAEPAAGSSLHGKVRSIEYHGHEWLARLETGVHLADIAAAGAQPYRPADRAPIRHTLRVGSRPAGQAWSGMGSGPIQRLRRAGDSVPPDQQGQGHGGHRRADIVVRLDSLHGWAVGQEVSVAVDVPHIYLFNADGQRIEQVPY
jgi:multiple sugar transport system ATP-binding protein